MAEPLDENWDVIIVGCGYAGAVAAIAAHDNGARVLVIEKMPEPGGISICSAGGLRIAFDEAAACDYLKASNRGNTPGDVLEILAHGMTELADKVGRLARAAGGDVDIRPADGNYPLPGYRSFGFVSVTSLEGCEPLSGRSGIKGGEDGYRLFKVLERALAQRCIEVRVNTSAVALLTDETSAVCGITVETETGQYTLGAPGGVVLACGGFEADPEMQAQFWNGMPVRSAAFAGNTGDGIRLAQSVGADLWHMWHYHGTYGFHHTDPDYPFAIRTKRYPDWVPGIPPDDEVRMPWILVDRQAARFMNEYDPYLQDTGARPFGFFDPQIQDFPRQPAWLVADEVGRKRTAFGRPTYHHADLEFEWSADNLAEVDLGILHRAGTLGELASVMEVEEGALNATVERWNAHCRNGADADFHRPGSTMMPIRQPPFYTAQVWPLVNNTQGGPVHDASQQVLNVRNEPIGGLYAAGELGSAFGFLYLSGGNLAECFIGGEIAGTNAARRGQVRVSP